MRSRPSSSHSARIHRRVQVYRSLFVVAALGGAALLLRARCSQMDSARNDALDHGLALLADALAHHEPLDTARTALTGAARLGVGDEWALFCLSAVEELDGAWSPEAPPPEWTAGVTALREGRLAAAREAFEGVAAGADALAPRARRYVRLIAVLEVAARDRAGESS